MTIDYIGMFFIAFGVYYTGRKKWFGWLLNIIGQIIYIIVAIKSNLYGLLTLNIILTILALLNLYNWINEKK